MKQSAGILLYRMAAQPEFFLVHPGGPFFRKKDAGWWSIPKGEPLPGEILLEAALREFEEETGFRPGGKAISLLPVVQKGGKQVHCWAIKGELDPATIVSNTFPMEWPPRSGRMQTFPEIDKAGWFDAATAREMINEKQVSFIDELLDILHGQ